MRILVRDHRKEQHGRDKKELLKRFIQVVEAGVVDVRWKLARRSGFGSLT
jgi:hypothetical protein